MPFSDAKYPHATVAKRLHDGSPVVDHFVRLSNGQVMLVRETKDGLQFATYDDEYGEVGLWVCQITSNGVLAYAHSSDACEELSLGLPGGAPPPEFMSDEAVGRMLASD